MLTIRLGTSLDSRKGEPFNWTTVPLSQRLAMAMGDWFADPQTGLELGCAAWRWTRASHAALFWAAIIVSRPLGATLGDFLDKPLAGRWR